MTRLAGRRPRVAQASSDIVIAPIPPPATTPRRIAGRRHTHGRCRSRPVTRSEVRTLPTTGLADPWSVIE